MTLLIMGGIAYALLILFVGGAMVVSGRASDREEKRLQPLYSPAAREAGKMALPLSRQPHSQRNAA